MNNQERMREVKALENVFRAKFGIKFSRSYRQFLLNREEIEEKAGFKLPVFGLPTKKDRANSVLATTEFLRKMRPDLKEKQLVCIRFIEDWALCLDLDNSTEEDCPLVQIHLSSKEAPIKVYDSFEEAKLESIEARKRSVAARQRVENRRREVEERKGGVFSHKEKKGERTLQPKPTDWHPVVMRIHDVVVARVAFRYNRVWGALEVDEFYVAKHPFYEEEELLRGLVGLVFSWARELGGSLNIVFSRDLREDLSTGKIIFSPEEAVRKVNQKRQKDIIYKRSTPRIPRNIPKELINLAAKYGVSFEGKREGRISHKEAVELFFATFELPGEVQEKIEKIERAGYFNKEFLCQVMAAGVWSGEEVIWFFLNVPRPEAVVLGTDVPENWLFYSESVNWANSVHLVSLLKQKILVDLTDGLSAEEKSKADCQLEPMLGFWIFKANQDFYLPWQIRGSEPVLVAREEPVLILSLPRQTTNPDYDKEWLSEKLKALAEADSEAKIRCLLVGFEFTDLKYGMKISEEMKDISRKAAEKGINILFSPFKLDILNDEVEKKMGQIRRIKRFSSRTGPLKIRIIEVPKESWNEPALLFSVEDVLSAASWIRKKIDVRLGRIRFRTNSKVIERVALQGQENRVVAELDIKDVKSTFPSLETEGGITLSFVLPDDVPDFLKKIGDKKIKKAIGRVKGGLVFVPSPLEKSDVDLDIKPAEKEAKILISSDFQFPIDPERIEFGNYGQQHREKEINRFHVQIQEALRTGQPLAVSYLPHDLFPEVMRDYVYYDVSAEPAKLRIGYSDGTEGEPFSLFCLENPKKFKRPDNLYLMPIGSISMRHVNLDLITEGYLIQNIMIKHKDNSADQEDYAFRRTWHFLVNFVDLVQHKRVEEIIEEKRFKFYWNWLKLEEKKYEALELHIYQTGLEPAVVGIYRAIVEFLKQRRGELIVVPRLINYRDWKIMRNKKEGIKGITQEAYIKAREWL